MNENGVITSVAQGWAEAAARQPLILPGPKSTQNEFGRGDGSGVSPSPQIHMSLFNTIILYINYNSL